MKHAETARQPHAVASVSEIAAGGPAIRVVLADDHPALRLGIRVLLEQAAGIAVVGEAGDGREALEQIVALQPTVAVVDCQMPSLSGPEIAAEVRRRGLSSRLVALSAYRDERLVRGMIGAGAVGYLLKEEAPGTIVAAVRAAAAGQGWFSASVAAWIGRSTGKKAIDPNDLTERERVVLHLVAMGKTNKEIGRRLGITERTIGFHIGNVLRKLGMGSRVEAALWAKDHGLLEDTTRHSDTE